MRIVIFVVVLLSMLSTTSVADMNIIISQEIKAIALEHTVMDMLNEIPYLIETRGYGKYFYPANPENLSFDVWDITWKEEETWVLDRTHYFYDFRIKKDGFLYVFSMHRFFIDGEWGRWPSYLEMSMDADGDGFFNDTVATTDNELILDRIREKINSLILRGRLIAILEMVESAPENIFSRKREEDGIRISVRRSYRNQKIVSVTIDVNDGYRDTSLEFASRPVVTGFPPWYMDKRMTTISFTDDSLVPSLYYTNVEKLVQEEWICDLLWRLKDPYSRYNTYSRDSFEDLWGAKEDFSKYPVSSELFLLCMQIKDKAEELYRKRE